MFKGLPDRTASTRCTLAASNAALDAFMEGSADLVSLSHQRYGLPAPGGEPPSESTAGSEQEEGEPAFKQGEARRHLSAHERRLAKKAAVSSYSSTMRMQQAGVVLRYVKCVDRFCRALAPTWRRRILLLRWRRPGRRKRPGRRPSSRQTCKPNR